MLGLLYYECHWYTLNLRNETLQDSNMEVITDLEARRKLGMYAL